MDRKTEVSAPLEGRRLNEGRPAGAGQKPRSRQAGSLPPVEREAPEYSSAPAKAPRRGAGLGKSGTAGQGGRKPSSSGDRRPARKRAKPLTQSRVRNIAEHYVGQRECSAQMLREVLERRLTKYLRDSEEDLDDRAVREEAAGLIEAEIARLVGAGLIDDARFAEMKSRSWLSTGRGSRRILMDLARKGIDEETARRAFDEAAREVTGTLGREDVDDREAAVSAEWEAADNLAKKKRLGRYRTKPLPEDRAERQKLWRREASAMARAGFGMDIIYQFLDREASEEA